MNWQNLRTNLGLFALSAFISVVLLELTLFTLNRTGYLNLLTVPNYTLADVNQGTWIADINSDFGVWHPANATYRHQNRCFDVIYQANSYGARDIERPQRVSGKRVIVLGDSFVEGFGVAAEERFSNRLETVTGVPHLNFGTNGDFGPTQYYLLYKTLAQHFDHTHLLIGILPANDFADDDPKFGRSYHVGRYRPYWIGDYPNYRLTYFVDSLEKSTFRPWPATEPGEPAALIASFKRFLRRFSYTYDTFLQAIHVMRGTAVTDAPDYTRYAGYYDYTDPRFNRLKYSLEQLIALAGGKSITIFTIPVKQDFERYSQVGPAPLSTALEAFSREHHINYIDLLPLMYHHTDNWQDYFLWCDAHWNGYGHQVAAEYLQQHLAD